MPEIHILNVCRISKATIKAEEAKKVEKTAA